MLDPSQETPVKPGAPNNGGIRYRSPSAAELLASAAADTDTKMKRADLARGDVFSSQRCRSLALAIAAPVILITFVLYLIPRSPTMQLANAGRKTAPGGGAKSYAVIFDAGSSGSRVHVYCFDRNLDLVHIGKELELFVQIKPGLSAYAKDPQEAAASLLPLLEKAESVIPVELLPSTPVRVGATAGLRQLGSEKSEQILQAVKDLLQKRSSLKFKEDWVTVLDGSQEGTFEWVTINYLLGNLGKDYSKTVGVVDLGGGSVQMAYAISEQDAAHAPRLKNGEDSYVQELLLKGTKYHLYVHSYLHYGLLAARAEMLKDDETYSYCMFEGYDGIYKYGDETFKASAAPSGPSYTKCRDDAAKALKIDESTCSHMKCTFGDVWNGGGGDGQKNLFVASFFFDRAAEAGFVDPKVPVAKVKPSDFEAAAKRVCSMNIKDAKTAYPAVPEANLPYLCMDLVYQYTLLIDGFGLKPHQVITLVKQVKYGDALVEAAWPLGSAIEVASAA